MAAAAAGVLAACGAFEAERGPGGPRAAGGFGADGRRGTTPARAMAARAEALAAGPAVPVAPAALAAECGLATADRATTPSHACMSCHDGSTAKMMAVAFMGEPHGGSHPVAIDYGLVAAARPGTYAPSAGLPPEVVLVEGRIECTTCHAPAGLGQGRVVDPVRLCTHCHRM